MEAITLSSAVSLRHNLKTNATKEKKWSVGEDFKDPSAKDKSKMRSITEVKKSYG